MIKHRMAGLGYSTSGFGFDMNLTAPSLDSGGDTATEAAEVVAAANGAAKAQSSLWGDIGATVGGILSQLNLGRRSRQPVYQPPVKTGPDTTTILLYAGLAVGGFVAAKKFKLI